MQKPEFILKMEQELQEYYNNHPEHKLIDEVKSTKSKSTNPYPVQKIDVEKWNKEMDEELKQISSLEKPFKKNFKAKGYKKSKYNKIIKKMTLLSGVEPESKFYTYLKYKGNEVMSFKFNGSFSKEKIRLITNQMSEYLKSKNINGKITSSLFYDEISWRSSQFSNIGNEVELFDSTYNGTVQNKEQKKFKKFVLYLIIDSKIEVEEEEPEQAQAIMGADYNNNDCLYNCLEFILMKKNPFKNPAELKKFCNVSASSKIPLSYIPMIEKKIIGFKINVSGDYEYKSNVISNKEINLILRDEHITINYKINNKKSNCRREEKQIILYDKATQMCYDGIEERKLGYQERYKILNDYNSKYIIINRMFMSKKKISLGLLKDLKSEYDEMIFEFDKIKQATNGMINFYRTGNMIDTAKTFFNKCSLFLTEPEELSILEHLWIKKSSIGALTTCIKNHQSNLYKYDINSMYPWVLKSQNKLPIKQGEFKIITNDEFNSLKYYTFGIYRAVITPSQDDNINRLFKFNYLNHYTHITLEQAKELGLKIKLIEDNEYNFLHYSREKLITFNEVFSNYVDYLFDLKQQKISPYIKTLLNILWGSFCEINKKKLYLSNEKDKLNISKEYDIFEMRPCASNDNLLLIKTVKNTNIYKNKMARISPFILSIGRKTMSDLLLPYKNNVKYIRTDGFLLDVKPDNLKLGNKLGDLRYEGYYENGLINNMNSIDGEYFENV